MKKTKEKDKTKQQQPPVSDMSDILVFGYSSKVFRDDAKALAIERGENFVPWMGDPSLLLDRYDARIFLNEIDVFTASNGDSCLEEYERAEEELCEEERWKSLYKDDADEEALEEEDEKRGRVGGQIGFSYEEGPAMGPQLPQEGPELPPPEQQQQQTVEEDGGGEYLPDPELRVPPGVLLPPNNKLYAVILKTAKFLSNQNSQMEILLKAKQSGNPAFQFLNYQDPLHEFYRHLKMMLKTKQYSPDREEQQQATAQSDQSAEVPYKPQYNYTGRTDSAPQIPSFGSSSGSSSQACSYLKLINKIKSVAPPPKAASPPPPAPRQPTPPPQRKERTPPLRKEPTPPVTKAPSPLREHRPSPPPSAAGVPAPLHLHPHAATLAAASVPPPHHLRHLPPPPFPPPPPLMHPGLPPPGHPMHVGPPPPNVYGHPPPPSATHGMAEMAGRMLDAEEEGAPPPGTEEGLLAPPGTGVGVVAPPGEDLSVPVLIPPPKLQTIIDKMASYVARNGRTFEEVVKNKDKDRFSFLLEADKHHSYYLHKLQSYTTGNYDPKLVPEPVNFKVKKSEEKEPVLETPSALPAEDSPENGEAGEADGDLPPLPPGEAPPPPIIAEPRIYQKEEDKKRLAEETKLKDKLAAAAREKMILTAKEKAMQLERKRKAATFLAQLAERKTTVSSVQPVEGTPPSDQPLAAWPPLAPPGPPQLVIPTLAAPPPQAVIIQSSDSDSSDDEERSRRKKKKDSRKRSRSRSRSRSRHKKRSKRRSRSRSSSRRRRSKRDKRSKRRRRRSRSSRRRRRHSSSSGSGGSSSNSDDSVEEIIKMPDTPPSATSSTPQTKENTPSIDEPKGVGGGDLNKMKEDLRAKVRAMLGSTS